jgi:hypothetical protein
MATYIYRGGTRDGEVETSSDLVHGQSWRAKESKSGTEMGVYLVTSDREHTDGGAAAVIRFMPDRERARVQVWLQHDDVVIDQWQTDSWDAADVPDEYVIGAATFVVKGITGPELDGFGRTVYRVVATLPPSA